MPFTKEQYEQAIENLQGGMTQLEPNAENCHICGDSGHYAGECRFNPLKAMAMCVEISKTADQFHDELHWFAGYQMRMGEQVGPAATVVPDEKGEG